MIAGRDNSLTIEGGAAACVEDIALARTSGTTEPLKWAALPDGRITATIPKAQIAAGQVSLLVRQQGIADVDTIALTALTETGRIDAFTLHAGDLHGVLTGTRLDTVASLSVDGAVFSPGAVVRTGKADKRVMTVDTPAPVAAWTAGQDRSGRVTLKDGRVLPVTVHVAPARPSVTLIDKTIAPAAHTASLPIILPSSTVMPLDASLTFSIRGAGRPGSADANKSRSPRSTDARRRSSPARTATASRAHRSRLRRSNRPRRWAYRPMARCATASCRTVRKATGRHSSPSSACRPSRA
ncbi:hypothetical protein QP185_09740 [Sphingomonas aerolata]|uniref:hypothetical protein n=1 Tax=Sphingomonas aerolata TaxID=185951 RepID=UPI002FE04ECA